MEAKLMHKQPEQGTGSDALSARLTGPQVYLRLRPSETPTVSTTYTIDKDGTTLTTTSKANRSLKHFCFTSIFDQSVDQSEIYERCVSPHVIAEEGLTIMMYGTSGSGKTYTMLGKHALNKLPSLSLMNEHFGIIPRALNNIFTNCRNRIQKLPVLKLIRGTITSLEDKDLQKELLFRKSILDLCPSLDNTTTFDGLGLDPETKHDPDETVLFWVSYLEIHNELVYDLLAMPSQRFQKLKIIYNKGEVFVDGLTSVFVTNAEEALRLLHLGHQRAACASTQVNDRSSRSHCLFTLDMLKCNSCGRTIKSFKFCDLAGSERVRASGSTGQRLIEAKHINRSLMVLGRCIAAACSVGQGKNKVVVIPHRDSKLTSLLHTAMLGKDKIVMILVVLPNDTVYEENQNVLTFAAIAKNIVFPDPTAKNQVLSNLKGRLDLSNSAGSSEHATQLERDKVLWENKRISVKRELLLVLQEVKEHTEHCRTELMAAHKLVNDEICEKQEKLKIEMKCIMEQIELLNSEQSVSFQPYAIAEMMTINSSS